MTTPDWDLYRSLLAVIDSGSLSGAARALGLSQPTIGRHVEALEEALGGAPLFTRSPGGLAPTEVALALKPHAEAMAVAAEALMRTASGEADQARGVVRVTASEIVGVEVLPPILAGFHEAWPDVTVEMALSNQQQDLLRRDADIAVRMARPTQGALTARRIGAVPVGLFAHRRYIEKHGAPASLREAAHTGVGFDRDVGMQRVLDGLQLHLDPELFAFRSDSDLAQLAMVRAGFGIGGCQFGIARRDPDLVQVLEHEFRFEMEVWVAMHEDLKASRRMRLMFDWLADGLAEFVRASRP